jgi:hypothetical protein
MEIYINDSIQKLINTVRSSEVFGSESDHSAEPCVPIQKKAVVESDRIAWSELKRIYEASDYKSRGISLRAVCQGSGIVMETPSRVSTKTPELVNHLKSLQEKLDKKKYDEMVHAVTVRERRAVKDREYVSFQSYKEQMRFGAHVLTMMAVFFLFGYAISYRLFDSNAYRSLCGIVFMFLSMVLETLLFVMKSSKEKTPVPKKMNIPTQPSNNKKKQ